MNFRRLMKASSDYSLAKTGTDGVVEGDGWLAGMRYVLRLNQSSNLLHQPPPRRAAVQHGSEQRESAFRKDHAS
jgi:hypothetical protein